MALPKTCAAWKVNDFSGFDGTVFVNNVQIGDIGDHDCLIKIEAASLNFRDLMIAKVCIQCMLGISQE
jgi:NADPH:quinone reductase-like Zn-dependent oxidoreductase